MNTTAPTTASPWLYFLAGTLLPTIGYYFLQKSAGSVSNSQRNNQDPDDSDDDDDSTAPLSTNGPSSKWGYTNIPYKMLLCVNQDLGMGKGKIAAQCAHAAVGCVQRAQRQCPTALAAWQRSGCAKIAVKCPNAEELETLAAVAMSKDMPVYLVEDAGRTQIAAGSKTVLGIFGPVKVFEGVTDHLKLM